MSYELGAKSLELGAGSYELGARSAQLQAHEPVVLMGALALHPGPWWERAVANGLLDYTDAYNFHFYGYAADLTSVIDAHRSALRELGAGSYELGAKSYELGAGWRVSGVVLWFMIVAHSSKLIARGSKLTAPSSKLEAPSSPLERARSRSGSRSAG